MKRVLCVLAACLISWSVSGADAYDISGSWSGTWRGTYSTGSAEMVLERRGDKIEGTFELFGSNTLGYGRKSLTGTVNGNQITITVIGDQCTFTAELELRVGKKRATLDGTFRCASQNTLNFVR